jgi:hypothetical protein
MFLNFNRLLAITLAVFAIYFVHTTYDFYFRQVFTPKSVAIFLQTAPYAILPIIPVVSQLDFWGLPETIEFSGINTFNPALLSFPNNDDSGSNRSLVVITSEEYKTEEMDGAEVQPRQLIAGILDIVDDLDPKRRWIPGEYPKSVSHSVQILENLVHSHDTQSPKCEPDPLGLFYNNQGPEDGRLVWSHLGEPLLIYHSISPKHSKFCRGFYLVDFRTVYPAFEHVLSPHSLSPPIRFPGSVPLSFAGQEGLHQAWSLFTDYAGQVLIHVNLVPQKIYKLRLDNYSADSLPTISSPASDLVTLDPIIIDTEERNCLTLALTRFTKDEIHQSGSPFIELVLCTSSGIKASSCDPNNPGNRAYIGVIEAQHGQDAIFHETRIVLLNSSYPFNYIGVSKPLKYSTSQPFYLRVGTNTKISGNRQRPNLYHVSQLSQSKDRSFGQRARYRLLGRFFDYFIWLKRQ